MGFLSPKHEHLTHMGQEMVGARAPSPPPPGNAQGTAPTSAGMQTPQGAIHWALTACLAQPIPEQVASVLMHRGASFHDSPLHLKVKCIAHPHPPVERGHLHRHIQTGCQFESVWECLAHTVRA